jgi:cytoskeletal protein CcmA (bactofilin family)
MAFKNLMAKAEEAEERSMEITPEPSVRSHQPAALPSCIDASCEFSGTIQSPETIRIDGRVKGEVHCEQTVIVGESASIQAVINAASIVICGEVKGDMSATNKITLQKTARVTGDLRTPGIVIEEGAKLEGRIVIGPDEQPAAPKQPNARSSAQPRESTAAPASQGTTPPGP